GGGRAGCGGGALRSEARRRRRRAPGALVAGPDGREEHRARSARGPCRPRESPWGERTGGVVRVRHGGGRRRLRREASCERTGGGRKDGMRRVSGRSRRCHERGARGSGRLWDVADVPVLREGGLSPLRERLRPSGVSPGRPCRTLAVADGTAVA